MDVNESNESDKVYLSLQRVPGARRLRPRLLSRMSTDVSTVSPTLLTLLILILSSVHGKDIGEECMINNSEGPSRPGVCKLLTNCQEVYEELLAGKTPNTSCGYLGFEPIVCCPTSKPTTSTERTGMPQPLTINESRGSVARAVCAENAKEVWGLVASPTLTLERVYVNVSRCAVEYRKLIVGGTEADPKEFPHMTAVGYGNENDTQWLCGGTLISGRIVLTAAHCLYTSDWGVAKWARVGDLNLKDNNDDALPETIEIVERIAHPNYKSPSVYHDIGIMKLKKPVTYNAWVRPACLPVDLPDTGNGDKAVATGWGRVDWYEDKGSNNLLKVTIKYVLHESCNDSYFEENNDELAQGIVDEWQICAGEPKKDTCQGDSGGPLTIFNKVHECMYNVVGVTSVGRLCGDIIPGVYTRVYHYIPWIERTAWPEYFISSPDSVKVRFAKKMSPSYRSESQ